MECGRDVEWCAEMWWTDSNYGDVKCGATDVELMLPDMVRLKCRKISVVWNTAWCGMLRNAGCGKLRCDVKCGDVELWRRMS